MKTVLIDLTSLRTSQRPRGVGRHVRELAFGLHRPPAGERCGHLLNYVPDEELASLHRRASAHLIASRHGGLGLTVAEAMACGCPVITTRRTAFAEVAGDAAIHVDPTGTPTLARSCFELPMFQRCGGTWSVAGWSEPRCFPATSKPCESSPFLDTFSTRQ